MIEVDKFKKWLQDRGCEILPTTNQYESLRFKGKEVGVLYKSGKTNGCFCNSALNAFKKNKKWDGAPINTGRYKNYIKEKSLIIERDGTKCFYCGVEMKEDITIEHLISLSSGGKNELSNMVLAHKECNNSVRNLPIYKKVEIAIKNRIQ